MQIVKPSFFGWPERWRISGLSVFPATACMHEKLISRVNRETGMWTGGIAFFIALLGGVLALTVLPRVGGWIATAGILLGLFGGAIHFVMNWGEIFHVDPPSE